MKKKRKVLLKKGEKKRENWKKIYKNIKKHYKLLL